MNLYKYNSKTPCHTALIQQVKDSVYLLIAAFCAGIYPVFVCWVNGIIFYLCCCSQKKITAVIAIATGQGICLTRRALVMSVYMNKLNICSAENTFHLHPYFFISAPDQPPSSMLQAMPR